MLFVNISTEFLFINFMVITLFSNYIVTLHVRTIGDNYSLIA